MTLKQPIVMAVTLINAANKVAQPFINIAEEATERKRSVPLCIHIIPRDKLLSCHLFVHLDPEKKKILHWIFFFSSLNWLPVIQVMFSKDDTFRSSIHPFSIALVILGLFVNQSQDAYRWTI